MLDEMEIRDEAIMGQFLRDTPEKNLNTFLNGVLTRPLYAFTPEHTAVVVQQKQIPDLSFYQGLVNWDKMREKTDAVIIRAGQKDWVDTRWGVNGAGAKARGMLRGAYWFYDDRLDPGRQADKFIELLRADPPEMEVWCDWETSYGGAFGSLKNVVAFMERVEAAGFKIGMYTGYYWFVAHSNAIANASQYAWLKTRPLWLAWYTTNSALVLIPAPWSELFLWQFGTPAVGYAYGCETTELDMNYINMTDLMFNLRYGVTTTPAPTDPDPIIGVKIMIDGRAYQPNVIEEI